MPYNFEEFKKDFDKTMNGFVEAFKVFPWEDQAAYTGWCAQTFYYVSHSTRLLALGAARCTVADQGMHRRFLDHLSEEKGHEKLALNDIKKLGQKIENHPELPETGLFYQNEYYWLNYHGSIAFFGWILALEGGAVHALPAAYERVTAAHGKAAASFMGVHAEEDIDHLDKALDQIKNLPSADLLAVAKNMQQSSVLYWAMLEKVSAAARTKDLSAAA